MEPAQICDILKGIILVVCCTIMTYIDTSMMYHLVRGQSTIKLYVFFNMLDVSMLTLVKVFTIIPECFKILRLTFSSQLGRKWGFRFYSLQIFMNNIGNVKIKC